MSRYGMREYIERLEQDGDLVAVAPEPKTRTQPMARSGRARLMGVLALCLPMLAAAASGAPTPTGDYSASANDGDPACELTGAPGNGPEAPLRLAPQLDRTSATRTLRKLITRI